MTVGRVRAIANCESGDDVGLGAPLGGNFLAPRPESSPSLSFSPNNGHAQAHVQLRLLAASSAAAGRQDVRRHGRVKR